MTRVNYESLGSSVVYMAKALSRPPLLMVAGEAWKAIERCEARMRWVIEDHNVGLYQSVDEMVAAGGPFAVRNALAEKFGEVRQFVDDQFDAMIDRAWLEATIPSPMLSR